MKNYNLIWARDHALLTQAQAAEKCGVTRRTFSRWETGEVEMPARRWKAFLLDIGTKAEDIPARVPDGSLPPPPSMPGVSDAMLDRSPDDWTEDEMQGLLMAIVESKPKGVKMPQEELFSEVLRIQKTVDAHRAVKQLIVDGYFVIQDGFITPTEKGRLAMLEDQDSTSTAPSV